MIEQKDGPLQDAARTVSVVTVAFNSAQTIERTLESVAAQTYPHVEHIIVDGGSADGTMEIVRRFERSGLRWISERDRGMYDAMNKGLALATGMCVGILNSDDWLEPDALSDVAACFESEECGYTFGDVYLANPDGRRFGLMASMDLDRLGRDYLYTMPYLHQTCYIRRSLLGRIGQYSLEYRLSADHEYIIRLIASGASGTRLRKPIATYRMGGRGGGLGTFVESRNIAMRYGMSPVRAYSLFAASLAKVWLAGAMPRGMTRTLMKFKKSRHTWY